MLTPGGALNQWLILLMPRYNIANHNHKCCTVHKLLSLAQLQLHSSEPPNTRPVNVYISNMYVFAEFQLSAECLLCTLLALWSSTVLPSCPWYICISGLPMPISSIHFPTHQSLQLNLFDVYNNRLTIRFCENGNMYHLVRISKDESCPSVHGFLRVIHLVWLVKTE